MLQQTRASVVIPYFDRWMRLFPDLPSLAGAPLEDVIKAWEGLGYYGRARHLHEGARQILARHGGKIPSARESLEKIKGIGPYTVNALLSFAFRQRAAPVDGNVLRTLARYFFIDEEISRAAVKKQIQELAQQALDQKKPWVTGEALIELGALVCQPKPLCALCPLHKGCKAFLLGRTEDVPVKPLESPATILSRSVAVIEANGCLLLKKGLQGKVMADLYEFPYFEGLKKPLLQHLQKLWGLQGIFVRSLPFVRHSFTRYQAHLFPIHVRAPQQTPVPDCEWIPMESAGRLPFSAGHRRVFDHFLKRNDPQLTLF